MLPATAAYYLASETQMTLYPHAQLERLFLKLPDLHKFTSSKSKRAASVAVKVIPGAFSPRTARICASFGLWSLAVNVR